MRLFISAMIGSASGAFCWFLLCHFQLGAADFTWAIRGAQQLLAHKNPYDNPEQLYPLTAAVFGLPFVQMRAELAGGIFYGISSALMAFGLTRHGYHRLLVFLAYPYWAGLLTAQWPPLIMASAFFSFLLPSTLAKPQLGLPLAITNLSRRGLVLSVAFLLLTLAWMPRWPWLWIARTGHYSHFVPLLVLPGPLLLVALLRYRERDAWFLLLNAAMPQRWFYDPLALWLIPKSRRAIVWTVFFSWVPGVWRWYHMPHSFTEVGRWMVFFIYLPMLIVVLTQDPEQPASAP